MAAYMRSPATCQALLVDAMAPETIRRPLIWWKVVVLAGIAAGPYLMAGRHASGGVVFEVDFSTPAPAPGTAAPRRRRTATRRNEAAPAPAPPPPASAATPPPAFNRTNCVPAHIFAEGSSLLNKVPRFVSSPFAALWAAHAAARYLSALSHQPARPTRILHSYPCPY